VVISGSHFWQHTCGNLMQHVAIFSSQESFCCSRLQLQEQPEGYEPGQQLKVSEMFKEGDLIDVAGTTIGKGFQGEFSTGLPPVALHKHVQRFCCTT
jgi:ribosomal protein L3